MRVKLSWPTQLPSPLLRSPRTRTVARMWGADFAVCDGLVSAVVLGLANGARYEAPGPVALVAACFDLAPKATIGHSPEVEEQFLSDPLSLRA